jgi:hypothetical protein
VSTQTSGNIGGITEASNVELERLRLRLGSTGDAISGWAHVEAGAPSAEHADRGAILAG